MTKQVECLGAHKSCTHVGSRATHGWSWPTLPNNASPESIVYGRPRVSCLWVCARIHTYIHTDKFTTKSTECLEKHANKQTNAAGRISKYKQMNISRKFLPAKKKQRMLSKNDGRGWKDMRVNFISIITLLELSSWKKLSVNNPF